jgi:hypothetical protein
MLNAIGCLKKCHLSHILSNNFQNVDCFIFNFSIGVMTAADFSEPIRFSKAGREVLKDVRRRYGRKPDNIIPKQVQVNQRRRIIPFELRDYAREISNDFLQKPPCGSMLAGYAAPGRGPDFHDLARLQKLLGRFGALPYLDKRVISGNDIYTECISPRPQYIVKKAEYSIINDPQNRELLEKYFVGRNIVFVCSGLAEKEATIIRNIKTAGAPKSIILNEGVEAIARQAESNMKKYFGGPLKINTQDILHVSFQYNDFWKPLKQDPTGFDIVDLGATEGNRSEAQQNNWLKFMGHVLRPQDRYIVGANNTLDLSTMLGSYQDAAYIHFALTAFVHSLFILGWLPKLDMDAINAEIIENEDQEAGKITITVDIINTKTQDLGNGVIMHPGRIPYLNFRAMGLDAFCDKHAEWGMELETRMKYEAANDPYGGKTDHGLSVFRPKLACG